MSNLQISGRLISATQTEQKTESFSVRRFVVEMSETNASGQVFVNLAEFQLTNAQCTMIDQFQQGQPVTVHFNIRGQYWNDKVITNLQAWKVEAQQQQQPSPQAQPTQSWAPQPQPTPQPQPQWNPPAPPAQMQPQPQVQPKPMQQWGAPQPQQNDGNLPF